MRDTADHPPLGETAEEAVTQLLSGRYRLHDAMRSADGTASFRAESIPHGRPVVVKAISRSHVPVGMGLRLERDGALLRGVCSPWVAELIDMSQSPQWFCFVSEYVAGERLKDSLAREKYSPARALQVAEAMFSGLHFLHGHNVRHREVRPDNIVLPTSDGCAAKLVDIGTECGLAGDSLSCVTSVERARYLSPEQSGSLDHDVAAPADLYSAGIVLFQMLTGRTPFDGDTVGDILFAHMTEAPPDFRQLGVPIPRALEDVVHRLLQKDPRDRYQTACSVLADLQAIRAALAAGESEPLVVVGSSDRRLTLTEPSFIARRRELQLVEHALHQVARGRAQIVTLEGESGRGKSRLLVEFARRGSQAGLWILKGQGSSNVAPHPLALLDGIVDAILAASASDPDLPPRLRAALGEEQAAVVESLPRLAAILESPSPPAMVRNEFQEGPRLHALAHLLRRLGQPQRPALLLLDDCQWADDLTLKLLGRLAAEQRACDSSADRHLMMVIAYRAEEVSDEHALRRLAIDDHLRLEPLTHDEVRSLAESMAGTLPADAVELIATASSGSPFMASAILRGLVETGALRACDGGWQFDGDRRHNWQSSQYAASLLTRRIGLLSPATLQLLTVGAVLGKEFPLEVATEMVTGPKDAVIDGIDEARQRHLVWLRPDESQCVLVHDRVRAALLEQLTTDQRQQIHRRAAEFFSRQHDPNDSDLAFHFDAAGDARRALPHALRAAQRALSQHALEIAEQQYRIAERAAPQADQIVQYRIAAGLGDVLMLRGKYDEAEQAFQLATRLAITDYEKPQALGKLAELAFKRGDAESAIGDFERALGLMGQRVPQRPIAVRCAVLWEVLVQTLHTLVPRLFVHRLQRQPTDAERLTVRLFSGLAHGYWYARGQCNSFWAHLRGMNLAERFLPSTELAQAYSEHAPGMTLIPVFSRAIQYARKSLEIRQQLGDLWGQGQSLHYYGCALYAAAEYAGCIEKCREAIRLLERMGDYWQVHIARYQIAASLYHLGDFERAIEESQLNYQSGRQLGDQQASGIILDVWVRASLGNIPDGILEEEVGRPRSDAQSRSQLLLAQGIAHLHAGQIEPAAQTIEGAVRVAESAGIRNAYTLPNYSWLATAYRTLAEQERSRSPLARRLHLQRARRAARRALRAARLCRSELPHALREYALIRAMQGATRQARRLFQRSQQVARGLGARHELAQSLLECGRIGEELGWSDAPQLLAEGRQQLVKLMPNPSHTPQSSQESAIEQPTLSLADRFDTVLDAGRRITGALSKTSIYNAARTAALRLLRGETCVVLEIDDDGPQRQFIPAAGDVDTPVNYDLVREATETGAVVVAANELPAAEPSASAAPEGSAICIPVYVRNRPAAGLYVTHRRIRHLFGRDERRLASFVMAIAGAACENAEGVEQLQLLNQTLEERVAERTAAAESATRAKSQFLATMTHEVRTPMNGILGMAELAMGTQLSSTQRNYLETIKKSGQALLTLLNDVLDLSKVEAGKMELECIRFDLREVVEDAVGLLATTAAGKQVELLCRVDPHVPAALWGDPVRLRQILVNLVGNAVKFTEQGEVFVDLNPLPSATSVRRLQISVRDTGIGIPPDNVSLIFDAFRQSDSSTTRKFGGTGLGLSISAELVRMMQGRIWVESQLGQGSTFYVDLPCDAASQAAAVPSPRSLAGVRALLVSSGDTSRPVYRELLEHLGARVAAVPHGEVAHHPTHDYEIIVADLRAAEMALPDTLADLRRLARHCDCGLIGLTPADGSGSRVQGKRERVVLKPVKRLELEEALLMSLDRYAPQEEAPAWQSQRADGQSLQVLLVDDSLVNQQVAEGLLEMLGHRVTCAANGVEALEAFDAGQFDVILMDLEMPMMDGLEATREIRSRAASGRQIPPIIAMTAHARGSDSDRFGHDALDGYVTKPIEPAVLMDVLEQIGPGSPVPQPCAV